MSKYATKAAGNMFCQARYEAAKFNERLGSREGGKIMDVRKVQDMRKNVELQYITEDSKTRIYLSVVREFNEKEYEEYSKKKKRAKIKKRIRFLKRSMVYIVPTAVSLIFFGYLSDMLCAIRGSAELGSEWIAIPLMWVWVYALTRFAVGDAY